MSDAGRKPAEPVIIPPKVTPAERHLYGDMAPVLRDVGLGVTHLHDALVLLSDMINTYSPVVSVPGGRPDLVGDAWRKSFADLGPLHDDLMTAFRGVAARAAQIEAQHAPQADPANSAFVYTDDWVPGEPGAQEPLTEANVVERLSYVARSTVTCELVVAPDLEQRAREITLDGTGLEALRVRVDESLPEGAHLIIDLPVQDVAPIRAGEAFAPTR